MNDPLLYTGKDGGVYQRFAPATCIMVVASTNTGKSYLVNQWLENLHQVFIKEPDEIVYVYEHNTKNSEMQNRLSEKLNITFHEGFPGDPHLLTNGGLFRRGERAPDSHRLLILDDVYAEAVACKDMARFCTTYAHHHQVSLHLSRHPPSPFPLLPLLLLLLLFADKSYNHGARCVRHIRTNIYVRRNNAEKCRLHDTLSRHSLLCADSPTRTNVFCW
jgi:hypothetical protein